MVIRMKNVMFNFIIIILIPITSGCYKKDTISQVKNDIIIPAIFSNVYIEKDGKMYIKNNNEIYYLENKQAKYTIENMTGHPSGSYEGITFDFNDFNFNGTLYYGLINRKDCKFPGPLFYKKKGRIENGKAFVNIKKHLSGKYDSIGWESTGNGAIGYRVVNKRGEIIYDGKINFKGIGPFEVDITIVEGPFVTQISSDGAVISFDTNRAIKSLVEVEKKVFQSEKVSTHHEIRLSELKPNMTYIYKIIYGDWNESYSFTTAPVDGWRGSFLFAFGSDSRSAQGGGERSIHGCNGYILKKFFSLAAQKNARFIQFTGDLIDGYLSSIEQTLLQYRNWKRVIEPFAHYLPVFIAMGNHESVVHRFVSRDNSIILVDRFPFKTESAEALFAQSFVNPTNGPLSEDRSIYDPDHENIDFPTYKENVYSYKYANIAVIVLNSNYWYSIASHKKKIFYGSNLHGYLMNNQIKWLEKTLKRMENNSNIDFIFVTQHTPIFPNGGHAKDTMWYNGDNDFRPTIAGKKVKEGIIERRDEFLRLLLNNNKVVAILSGDEHNYCRMEITSDMIIHPVGYNGKSPLELKRIKRKGKIWHIVNGAVGAPFYAQQKLPWSKNVRKFATQYACVFFHVHGKKLKLEVINPDTLEIIERVGL